MRILLTGFEPFGGSSLNPSCELVRAIEKDGLVGSELITEILPVIGGEGEPSAREALRRAIIRNSPDTVICFGESLRSTQIAFERVAVNLRDERIADNSGQQCRDQPVVAAGPSAYFSTLPVRSMRDACEAAGTPAILSLSAGSFTCNEIMYFLLHGCASGEFSSVNRGGFVHLPQLPEQAVVRGGPSMRLEHLQLGIRASLRELVSPLG